MNPASRVPMSRCYFCGDAVGERFMVEHVEQCGAVLEECPDKCGSFVPRRNLRSHLRQCVKRIYVESSNASPSRNTVYVAPLKNETTWKDNVFAALNLLRTSVFDGERERQWIKQNLSIHAERLEAEEKSLESLKQTTIHGLQDARQRGVAIDRGLTNLDKALNDVEERTSSSLNAIAYRLQTLERNLADERTMNTRTPSNCEAELRDLKKFVAKESAVVGDLWDSQTKRMNDLKLELEIRCKISRELENKQDILSEKIDIMVNEIRNHAEEMRKQSESVKKIKTQMKQVCALLEDIVDEDSKRSNFIIPEVCVCKHENISPASTNGRLLWRIDRYKEKITEAKENDTVIYSPIFQNKDYGYTLRMELYLNGRRQWKGRHVIGYLRVIEGPWDPLLDWPCVLRATVTLRDQDNPANNIRKIVKTRSRGLDDNGDSLEKDSGLYMFIPHTSLTRYDGFTKHDAMFLDIQITELGGTLSTSSLVA